VASKTRARKALWVPGCAIDCEGGIVPGTRLFATAKAARGHHEKSPCQAKPVRVRVSREVSRE